MAGVRVEGIITALGGHPTLCYKECSIINLFPSMGEGGKEFQYLWEDFQIQM